MLNEIYLKNYLFVPEARLQFKAGMCAITGETGAGKSVLVGAITLLFADNSQSFEAFDPSRPIYLEATFEIAQNPEAVSYLGDLGYAEEDLVLAREINPKGKSQYYIYGRKVAAGFVKELKPLLVDFHHQRDQQKLLSTAYQLDILDRYGSLNELVSTYRDKYLGLKQALKKLHKLRGQEAQNRQLSELYNYQFTELEKAGLKADEDLLLQNEYELLSAANEIAAISSSLCESLFETENSSFDQLNQALAQVSKYADLHENLSEILQNLNVALDAIEQSTNLLRNLPEQISYDPVRLSEISSRLDFINELKHKHRVTQIVDLLAIQARLCELVNGFSSLENEIHELETAIERDYQDVVGLAEMLSEKRSLVATRLCQEMESNIRRLSIPEGIFEIRIDKIAIDKNHRQKYLDALSEKGKDSIEFLFCANPGSSIKPLTAVASGGELSRILLAIKKVLAQNISPKLMILDEIDAGIGGKTAELIAQYIKDIAQRHNVMCITHLAQIAVVADQHISLAKTSENGKTLVQMIELDADARRNEIARMLSGNVTENALRHAEELLDK